MKEKDKTKAALLVIDTQNTYLKYIPDQDKEAAITVINNYIELFREYGCPIIRIYHYSKENGPGQGTKEFEFPESIFIRPDDLKVIKTYPDAFNKTDLDKILKDLGCNTLFMCGLSSTGCVLATWIGAFNHDYKPFLVKDAIMCHRKTYSENIEIMFEAVGHNVIKLVLENN